VSNKRTDDYGGSFENRTRFLLECVQEVRQRLSPLKGLWVRLSCSDWLEDEPSWRIEDTCRLAPLLRNAGADLIDCSSGAISNKQNIPTAASPGYQLPFAKAVKALGVQGLHVGGVGRLGDPQVAEAALKDGSCDLILNARAFLSSPQWTEDAGAQLLPPATHMSSAPQFWRAAVRAPAMAGQAQRGTR
jgi:2,4-dienoyl-CoA reductase-like NADH-dependent reductase (Old Yellow Enzyme family)